MEPLCITDPVKLNNDSDTQRLLISPNDNNNKRYLFYFWVILSSLCIANKMIFIGLWKINEFWIFFFENFAILLISIIYYFLFRSNTSEAIKIRRETYKDKFSMALCFISGLTNGAGNVLIIFSYHWSLAAGVSPASIMCLIYLNTIGLMLVGVICFNEKHTKMEYFGSIILLLGWVIITLQKQIDTAPSDFNFTFFYLSIIATWITSCFWGWTAVTAKIAAHRK